MSDASLFSAHWHKVRELRPKLADDVRVVRHLYRGRSSHLLHRPSTRAHHRLDSRAYDLVSRFDGRTSVDALWTSAQGRHGDEAPTQPELVRLLAALHEADLIVVDRELDAERLFRRGESGARAARRERLASPLYLRFKLCDPDRWLSRLAPLTRPLFTRTAFALWLALVLAAAVRLLPERGALAAELAALDTLSSLHAVGFLAVYVLMKLVHELAHALAIVRHGGAVREFGIALMVLLPNPYTDASAATLFASKRRRIQVSAAGIGAELGIAAVATFVWASSTGPLHAFALSAMLIGGLSTLLFNGNPLLKFDGYYVLADWLEIPNLAERSRRLLLGRAGRMLFGLPDAGEAGPDRRERQWLIGYGVASTLYRIVLMLGIAWLLSGRYFFFGALLAAYVAFTLLAVPAGRLVAFVHRLPPGRRARGIVATLVPAGALLLLATALPLPYATVAEGVVWLPEDAVLRAGHRCDVVETFATDGETVAADVPLVRCEDVELEAERKVAAARVRELAAAKAGLAASDPLRHRALTRDLEEARAALALIEERLAGQLLKSGAAGRFAVEGRRTLVGRHFEQGAIIAYVVPPRARTIRVALTQDEIGRVERSAARVDVALRQHPGADGRLESRIVRRTPKPTHEVISPALTRLGGGRLAAREDPSGPRLLEPAFDVELGWADEAPASRVGGAVQVRFVHDAQPLAVRLMDSLQRAFMGRATS